MAVTVFPESADAVTEAVWTQLIDSQGFQADRIVEGFELTDPTGLFVDVEPGTAIIAGYEVVSDAAIQEALTASDVNYVYLNADGTVTVNITGTQPADSVYLGTATTDGSGITALSHDVAKSNGHSAYLYKSSNQTNDGSVTLDDDTDLAVTLGERQAWRFEANILASNTTAANGYQWNFRAASGIIRLHYSYHQATPDHAQGIVSSTYTHSGNSSTSAVTSPTSTITGTIPIRITGIVITGDTAGSFRFRFAEGSGSGGAATTEAGSFMLMQRLAF